ncbi:MAG: rRNA maturation RNase YbeY [Acidimicrobiales bacterium]
MLSGEGVPQGRIDLHLVDADTITELNVEHMGASGPTDVLSFPLDDDPFALPDDEPSIIGDLVLCPSVAVAQAPEHAGTVDAELALLVIHGVLHLLGHDHAELDETIDMQARSAAISRTRGTCTVPAEPTDPPAP